MPRDRELTLDVKCRADEISRMILSEDYPSVDIAIARSQLRDYVEGRAPDNLALYDMIYESRFDRLWEQFRPGE